ncbi:MAG: EamA family transporter [Rhodoferax sp.]
MNPRSLHPAVVAALAAAALFGAATPLAKGLLAEVSPWALAGLLYAGSGLGLWAWRRLRRAAPVRLPRSEWGWLLAAVVCGGVLAPVLLMGALQYAPASGVSLLLNAEGVLTALLAWFAFREHFDRRIAFGMGCIVAGALVLSWPRGAGAQAVALWPTLAVLGACLGWALDNNFTRKVCAADATWVAMVKGLVAGAVNLGLALSLQASLPPLRESLLAMLVGLAGYGLSLTLFVHALRELGTARTGAYFSVAPFVGALASLLLLDESGSLALAGAGALMALGVYLHVTEDHAHLHAHEVLEHEHTHSHADGHHDHPHALGTDVPGPGGRHRHPHRHEAMAHAHAHYPDLHHRHSH